MRSEPLARPRTRTGARPFVEPGQPVIVVHRAQMLMAVPGIEQMNDERRDRDHREDDHDRCCR